MPQEETEQPDVSAQPETVTLPEVAESVPAEPAAPEQPVAEAESAVTEPEAEPPVEEAESAVTEPEAEPPVAEAEPAVTEPEAEEPVAKPEAEQTKPEEPERAGDIPAGVEPVQGTATPEMAPGSIEGSGLTTTIKGIPEDKRENILERFSNGIPNMIAAKMAAVLQDPSLIDAEKYSVMESGYDSLLCWASTASNMLWISGHAQHAISPYTNEAFKNVDEVFDYFRQNFTDELGYIEGGLRYFLDGEYVGQGIDGASQLKDVNAGTGNVTDAPHETNFISQQTDDGTVPDILGKVGDMANMTFGIVVKFWDTATSCFVGGHAITLVGITEDKNETDFTRRYKGVIVADSDNSPVSAAAHTDNSAEERAALAAAATNSYTFLPLTWEQIDNVYYWVMEGYGGSGVRPIIAELHWLSDYKKPEQEPVPENHETNDNKEDYNDNNDTYETTQTNAKSNETQPEQVVMEEIDINALKVFLILNNMLVFSTTGTKYRKSLDSEYSLYVRRLDTALLNVYLDGIRLSADGSNFRIIRLPNGMFKIVLSKELLQKLKEGKYTLRLEFEGSDPIDSLIEVN